MLIAIIALSISSKTLIKLKHKQNNYLLSHVHTHVDPIYLDAPTYMQI